MVLWKEMEIPDCLNGIIKQMEDVESCREELTILGQQWDLLTILGQMSGDGTDMTTTREGFKRLTSALIGNLGVEKLNKVVQEITSKAQVVVDIVIRNLFERTADIGFLATDDDIRRFLMKVKSNAKINRHSDSGDTENLLYCESSEYENDLAAILKRFQEYVAKYSVYNNIILLDTDGNVIAQLDQTNNVQCSADPLIQESLTTSSEYVETFRYSDLLPCSPRSLIYSFRVTESNSNSSKRLGVLCLCFRFENELERVFSNLIKDDDWSLALLLDNAGTVIASSDHYQIPIGAAIPKVLVDRVKLIKFAGRQYLAKTCPTKGYQKFMGLGWYGHVMLPLDCAFLVDDESAETEISSEILETLMRDSLIFSDSLKKIPENADRIQRDLDRAVWNGNLTSFSDGQGKSSSKVLLLEISKTGTKTKRVFERSIGDLNKTVISSILSDVEFFASLSIDIMDRNLYERANDCRWWALTSVFRDILSKGQISSIESEQISKVLAYINGLYTVYTNLILFDAEGKVIAVSNPSESVLVGTHLDCDWLKRVLSLRDSQKYCVSSFSRTELYGNAHTYVYAASITSLDGVNQVLGGIGIIFDSTPQFRAMLVDALPVNDKGEVMQGCFGLFASKDRMIISSTHESLAVGDMLNIDDDIFSLSNGEGLSRIIKFNECYYALGAKCSNGYREFKREDGYINDVISLIFIPLGEVKSGLSPNMHKDYVDVQLKANQFRGSKDRIEIATFFIGNHWLGVKKDRVVEAVSIKEILKIPGRPSWVEGVILFRNESLPVLNLSCEFDSEGRGSREGDVEVVVFESGMGKFGLIIDSLGEIPEVLLNEIEGPDIALQSKSSYLEGIVKHEVLINQGTIRKENIIIIIDVDKLRSKFL